MTKTNTVTETTGTGQTVSTKAANTFSHRPLTDRQVQKVETLRRETARLWDLYDSILDTSETETVSSEAERLVSLAKTQLEQSALWATKALSRVS